MSCCAKPVQCHCGLVLPWWTYAAAATPAAARRVAWTTACRAAGVDPETHDGAPPLPAAAGFDACDMRGTDRTCCRAVMLTYVHRQHEYATAWAREARAPITQLERAPRSIAHTTSNATSDVPHPVSGAMPRARGAAPRDEERWRRSTALIDSIAGATRLHDGDGAAQ